MKKSTSRKYWLALAGLLLGLALAIAGQVLFDPTSSLALALQPAGALAIAATLAGAGLAAWLAPARSDPPGLQPPAAGPSSRGEPPVGVRPAATPWTVPAEAPVSQHPWWLRPLGMAVALVAVALAQFLFAGKLATQWSQDQRMAIGTLATVAGMVLFALAAVPPDPALSVFGLRSKARLPVAPLLAQRWTLLWLAVALGGYGFSLIRFVQAGESRAVVLAWLLAIAALLISQWSPRRRTARPVRPVRPVQRSQPVERVYLITLAALMLLALILRTYRLTTLPLDLDGDFASHGLQARALATGLEPYLFRFGWANIPMTGFLPAALTMKVFGTGLAGLDAAGVIEGLGVILGVYLLGRQLFHPRVGLLAAALLTISYTHVHFSRTSEYIDSVFFMVYAVFFLVLGLQRGRGWAFVLSGLATAFSLQMYYSGRITLFVIAAIGLYLLLARRNLLAARWQGGVVWIFALLAGLGPMLIVFLRDWEGFVSRSREVFLFTPAVLEHLRNKYQVESLGGILWEQAKRTALVFHVYVDTSTQFGLQRPILDPVSSALLALGAGYALAHLRRFGHFLLIAWLGLILVLGLFLTNNAPFWPRLLGLLPPAALLAGLAVERIYTPLVDWSRQRGLAWVRPLAIAALVAGMAVVGVHNWNTYVESKGSWAMTRTRIGRLLAATAPQTQAFLVADPYSYDDREFQFLAPGRLAGNLNEEQVRAGEIPVSATAPTLIVLTPNHAGLLDVLRLRYAGGAAAPQPDNDPGSLGFYVFTIPPQP